MAQTNEQVNGPKKKVGHDEGEVNYIIESVVFADLVKIQSYGKNNTKAIVDDADDCSWLRCVQLFSYKPHSQQQPAKLHKN